MTVFFVFTIDARYDARNACLVKIAESLDSCEATEEDVSLVLRCLGDKILEQDAVIVLNNMSNPETALLAFGFLRKRLKPSRFDKNRNYLFEIFKIFIEGI